MVADGDGTVYPVYLVDKPNGGSSFRAAAIVRVNSTVVDW
jgi:hypothetical protein